MVDGLTYCHIQASKMYFVLTTTQNVQCTMLMELLQRLARVFKDYCGVLTEDSVRRNFLLLYELLDEVFDRGYPQSMSTEMLKAYVYNEPVQKLSKLSHLSASKLPSHTCTCMHMRTRMPART